MKCRLFRRLCSKLREGTRPLARVRAGQATMQRIISLCSVSRLVVPSMYNTSEEGNGKMGTVAMLSALANSMRRCLA